MPRLNLVQGTPEWHLYRERHVMATTASCLVGLNPYKTSLDVWEEMMCMSRPIIMNKAMQRGVTLEPEARDIACEVLKTQFDPCVYQSDRFYWQAASLDGINITNNVVLEIKCPNKAVHDAASVCEIPEYYICQLQHQISVTNASQAIYFSYRPKKRQSLEIHKEDFIILDVYPNKEFIKELEEIEFQFWSDYCKLNFPSEIVDKNITDKFRMLLSNTKISLRCI